MNQRIFISKKAKNYHSDSLKKCFIQELLFFAVWLFIFRANKKLHSLMKLWPLTYLQNHKTDKRLTVKCITVCAAQYLKIFTFERHRIFIARELDSPACNPFV